MANISSLIPKASSLYKTKLLMKKPKNEIRKNFGKVELKFLLVLNVQKCCPIIEKVNATRKPIIFD